MSSAFMLLIAGLYLGAAGSFAWEQKWEWALVALSWAVGNMALAWVSR